MRFLDPNPDAPAPTETAVIVPVPAAEPLVERHRQYLDPSAGWGIPAHVTVLYPFVHPSVIDEDVVAMLHAAIQTSSVFTCRFAQTGWFGDDVLWLDPEPADPFRQLTTAVWNAFPEYPPFGGAYDSVIPHLTIADRPPGGLPVMQATERAVRPLLPVETIIDRVLLITGTQAPRSWRTLCEISLADGSSLR